MSDVSTRLDDLDEDGPVERELSTDSYESVEVETDIRTLRERAKAFDEAQAAMPALQRENALLRSNINLETPLGRFFVDNYSGDPTDVEGLRAKAAELGVPFKGEPAQ